MSYLDQIKEDYNIKEENIYSLIVVSDNFKEPFSGWSGIVLKQVFGDKLYKMYFGDFSENLAAYENLQEFVINRRISKDVAADLLESWLKENVDGDLITVSSNARSYIVPFIKDLKGLINIKINAWDLRDMYSLIGAEEPLDTTGSLYDIFTIAKPLPKTFGLNAIANDLDISLPKLGEQPVYRAMLTAKVAAKLLE